jgi:exodeoxyribonuclease-3
MLKLVSWNVNGLRACLKKGFLDFFNRVDADIFCVQETKMQREQLELELPGYTQFWNSAQKKGYSGTAVFCKKEPQNVRYDIGLEEHATEGRVITLEYDSFFLVNVYTPNSKEDLKRLEYRMKWEDDFRGYLTSLDELKPVIVCGDLNVAHEEIDLKNPAANHKHAGFTNQEREKFSKLISSGFVDTFRYLHKEKVAYTWWSYRFGARARNAGWRIDYFLVSERSKNNIIDSVIHDSQLGSDHCPVEIQCEAARFEGFRS